MDKEDFTLFQTVVRTMLGQGRKVFIHSEGGVKTKQMEIKSIGMAERKLESIANLTERSTKIVIMADTTRFEFYV